MSVEDQSHRRIDEEIDGEDQSRGGRSSNSGADEDIGDQGIGQDARSEADSNKADVDQANADEGATGKDINLSQPSQSSDPSFLVVGIGASAGGLEAFQLFFRHMDENSGMAFVLISHLSPDHDSLLSEILGKETQMSVLQLSEDTLVRPNHVYVIPPNADLSIEEKTLQLVEPSQERGHRTPVDFFFCALAESQRENAVCVILSGTGSDGTIGLKQIKEYGGLAIAQDSGAKYDGMPRSAAMTGLVDYVLPVEEIPYRLVEYARHREELQTSLGEAGIFSETAGHLGEICSLLMGAVGHDFSRYKESTLVRRIQRRLQIAQVPSVSAYVSFLKENDEEVQLLFKDLLIGVTHFFRDRDAFAALKQAVIAPLVKASQPDGCIRIWVAGCSSGEEAYSIAILLSEEMARQNQRVRVQIFATDIDERALEQARRAYYPESIAQQITPERLERFFIKANGSYQVVKHLREMCIFSQHSLINDPPFSRLDLVSCRNLLIYFDAELQKKLIPLFHYALNPKRYLLLGSSENLVNHSEIFKPIDKQQRIFQCRQMAIMPRVDFPLVDLSQYRSGDAMSLKPSTGRQQKVTRAIERRLLQDYAPACVLINEQNEIVYFFGRTGKYLEPAQGVPSNRLFDLAKHGLRLDLRAAIQVATETRSAARRDQVLLDHEGQRQLVNLIVRPVDWAVEDSRLMMVIFQDVEDVVVSTRALPSHLETDSESQVVQQLEDELRSTREHLKTTIDDLEASNQELKSANEELMSMNEELQSSNEELQTSKEEMQSVNEEIEIVNVELQKKIEELDAVNSDVHNLFESAQIATVFLDLNLRIRKFTPAATRLFNFIEGDVGRPITDIALSLVAVDVVADIQSVLQSLAPIEKEIQFEGQSDYYKMRVLPYRTTENKIDGVALTFVDVSDLRRARDRAEQSAAKQRAIAELGIYALQSGDVQAVCDRAAKIVCQTLESDLCGLFVRPDKHFADREEQSLATMGDRCSTDLVLQSGSGWRDDDKGQATVSAVDSHLGYTLNTHQSVLVSDFSQETRFDQTPLFGRSNIKSGVSAIVYDTQGAYGVLSAYKTQRHEFGPEDISFLQAVANALAAVFQREKTIHALDKSRTRLDLAIAAGGMGVWELNLTDDSSTWNEMEYQLLGISVDSSVVPSASLFYSFVHPDDREQAQQAVASAIVERSGYRSEFRINRGDGQLRWLAAQGRVVSDGQGHPIKMIGINYDITERKQNEESLREADRRKNEFLAMLGHELRNPLSAISGSVKLMKDVEEKGVAEKDAEDIARAKSLYDIAGRQLEHLTRIIDDLLDVSRIVYGKIRIEREPVDLIQLIQNLQEDYQESFLDNEIQSIVTLPEQAAWVDGDANRLTQTFSNVIRNAIKFSYSGGQIEISARLSDTAITVEIADTGIGMKAEALSRIFIPFNQQESSLELSGGLGLGLPLAKGILELHGGDIWAESQGLGEGTTFFIRLPLLASERPSEQSEGRVEGDTNASVNRASNTANSPAGAPIRVLIIEDNTDAAFLLQVFFEDLGYEVSIARDGESGLAIARQQQPAVVLSDISLRGDIDGYAVARAMRSDETLQPVCLVAMSGYGQQEDKARAKAAGFDWHFTKPLDLDQIAQFVTQMLRPG